MLKSKGCLITGLYSIVFAMCMYIQFIIALQFITPVTCLNLSAVASPSLLFQTPLITQRWSGVKSVSKALEIKHLSLYQTSVFIQYGCILSDTPVLILVITGPLRLPNPLGHYFNVFSNFFVSTVEPPNKGHFGDNIVVSFVERLSSSRRFKMY